MRIIGFAKSRNNFSCPNIISGGKAIMNTKTKALIEQHFHGAYGVNFNKCTKNDVLMLAGKLKQNNGIGGIFPTLVTDSIENIKKQTEIIKSAAKETTSSMAEILGIHLEGIFINPNKKGIHNVKQILEPTVENYKKLEDDFIKIVTLAPERCREAAKTSEQKNLIEYLKEKGVKVQAGHCVDSDLSGCDGVTHLFNAMSGVDHHNGANSTALSALTNDNLYTEIIADGVHLSDDTLKLILKSKPENKILLVSDSLPNAGLTPKECPNFDFAGKTIFWNGEKSVDAEGVLAGSAKLLPEIIKTFASKDIAKKEQIEQFIQNSYDYHKITKDLGEVVWDSKWNIV